MSKQATHKLEFALSVLEEYAEKTGQCACSFLNVSSNVIEAIGAAVLLARIMEHEQATKD